MCVASRICYAKVITGPRMKQFADEWDDLESWKKRAEIIREGIIKGMKFERMRGIKGNFNPIIRDTRRMDGYTVENIAIESFPGFYLTGNLYKPDELKDKSPAVICTHGHKSNRGWELFEEIIRDNQKAEEIMRIFSPVFEKKLIA